MPQRVLNLQMLILKYKHSLKLQREISQRVSYSYLSCVHCTYSSVCTYLRSNMNITERDVELQKENCQKLTIAKGDNWKSKK